MTARRTRSRLGPALSRRSFLGLGVAAGLAVLAPAADTRVPVVLAAKPGGGPVTRSPVRIPSSAPLTGSTLTAAPATVSLGSRTSTVLAYTGLFPGPTFRATRGDTASIRLTNGLAEETTIHWHGMLVPPAADGQPQDAVTPGGSYTYQFPIRQRACLNWYHPHPHLLTGKQVALGLAGAFIITDAEEAALGLPSGAHEVPLILRDASFDSAGTLQYKPRSGGFLGTTPLVNGTLNPRLDVDTALYRFRVLNGANARIFRLALGNGAPFNLIGTDGGLLTERVTVSEIEVAPAERLDLLADFRGLPVGTTVLLQDRTSGWDLLAFVVTTPVTDTRVMPTNLSTITPLSSPVTTRLLSFDGMSKINGRAYDMDRIDFQVPFGQTERWRFTTNGNAPHPVHIHGASFQVETRTGGRGQVFPWERGWKDTVLLQDGETVAVLIRFDAYRGRYLIHCHKLEHEDMGMMANFEVI